MVKRRLKRGLAAALTAVLMLGCVQFAGCQKEKKNTFSTDGKTNSFTYFETVETIDNPGAGYTRTDWYHTKPGGTLVHDTQGSIVLFFVDLGPFSAGSNGVTNGDGTYVEGEDYDLDETFFNALRGTFENCRKGGSCIALRFRYDEHGKSNPEPKTFDRVLRHISQIKESGILEEYQDILMFVESGFVGAWGEQHGGKYTSLEYKAKLLEAMLDCVPKPIPVTVRTPDTFAEYVGIKRSELKDYVVQEGTDAARVGLYNDGYMGSDSDLGTYADREAETAWLGKQTYYSYFGGEFSGAIDFAKQYETYLPENCIPEMYKTHLSYINGNIFQLYKDYKFTKKLDVPGYDNSAYYGQTVYQFIRDHLGYRFVLKESSMPSKAEQGGTLGLNFKVTNNGFANPVKEQTCEILLEKDGNFVRTEVDLDPTKWYSGETVNCALQLKIPGNLEPGRWNVYFKSFVGKQTMALYPVRSVRFANQDVWNATLGANRLGFFDVTASDCADITFGEAGKEKPANLYNLGGRVTADGTTAACEWTEADVVATNEAGNKLYAKADEEYLYVMADMPHKSGAPVFNLRVTNAENNVTYWIYQQSNGFVYFNHEQETGHIGMQMKYSDKMFEFRVPFYMLGLENGSKLKGISVFIQDSADGWKGTGNISASVEYTVKSDVPIFNAWEKVRLKQGERYTVTLETDASLADMVWLKDGKALPVQSRTLDLSDLKTSDAGVYSVRITTGKGNVKEKEILELNVE